MSAKDFYKILGVPENASQAEIQKSFRKLAQKYHPDANPNDKHTEKKFKEINEAYQVLKDKEKRTQYDEMRKYGAFQGFGNNQQGRSYKGADFSEIFGRGKSGGGFGNFGDIFGDIFGFGGSSKRTAAKGDDIIVSVNVPFRTAAVGGKQTITINSPSVCQHCNGTGGEPGSSESVCPQCRGKGTINIKQGNFVVSNTCPTCLGRGKVFSQNCNVCYGTGEVTDKKTLNISIPAGISEGEKIRLRGQGEEGRGGKPRGDLIITVHIENDPFFERKNYDIYANIDISLKNAIAGTKIKIGTIFGDKVILKIPPYTESGTKFRIQGKGIHKGSNVGDMFVTVNTKLPKNLSEDKKNEIIKLLEDE